ncbi:MAG TPA: transglutaminase domain-containing protein, partial [Treponemataceae bacterium]|nr:transglutaminase domain-containing protein [Treponemataceae bacterium]
MKYALFFFRLILFLAISVAPALYPGIVLPFDAAALWRCFAFVPACMAIGFCGRRLPRAFGVPLEPLALAALVVSTAFLTGLTADFLWCVSWGAIAWAGSALAFRKGLPLALAPEPVLALWFAARIASFGRSSEGMAEACRVPGIAIAVGCALAWGVYAFMLYALAYESRDRKRRPGRRSAIIFSTSLVALLCAALVWFPDSVPQFVRELNDANRQLRAVPPEGDGYPRQKSQGSDPSRGGGNGGGPGGLFESDSKDWLNGKGGGSGGNQYLVMVVESPVPSLYLAENYLERLDPAEGFRADPANPYNALAAAPLLETWENPEITYDYGREDISINVYSCVPKKFMSWLPQRVEPVVQDRRYAPLQYTYRAESLVSICSIQGAEPDTFFLSEEERGRFAPYLETSLAPEDLKAFSDYARGLYADSDMPATRVDGILMGLSGCQYRLGMKDDVSVAALRTFLFETKTGDCSEFSNTAALLARLAGVPSRVVTGYTVQRELQSPSHVAGIKRLIKTFPPLAGKNPEDLYLVTTAHRHSWPQFYFSGWGWVDYESTKYAIPPEQGFDPNNM